MGLRHQIQQLLDAAPGEQAAIGLREQWWTWNQVNEVARAVDEVCSAAGLGEGARVGLALQNRPEFAALALGVLASGRCITTLNPMQPAARLAADIVRTAPPIVIGASSIIEQPEIRESIDAAGTAVVVSPEGVLSSLGEPREWHDAAFSTETAIEMLTSGTTGPPKRIHLGYAQLDSAFAAIGSAGVPEFSMSVAIVSAPLVHIGGLWHALNTLLAGRRLVLMEKFSVAGWVAEVETYRPKVVSLVPAALQSVLDADVPAESLASVRAVTSGTAPCPPELAEAVYDRYGIAVLTTYGATEFAGAVAGWSLADHRTWMPAKRGAVGRPFRGVTIRAVDPETAEPLETGQVGRLEVRSAQLGDAEEWTPTSDLGRLDEDGFLFITGRADDAILRGGFKVQPGTVQKALEAHPAVRAAAVAGIPDERLGQVPVAAVELIPGANAPTAEELKAWCREQLVAYEVPVQFRIVDELPRTVSLKISRAEVAALF
ncbi:MAG: class I adenylate-forming enzyme family protein [Aeromicrobium sp.]